MKAIEPLKPSARFNGGCDACGRLAGIPAMTVDERFAVRSDCGLQPQQVLIGSRRHKATAPVRHLHDAVAVKTIGIYRNRSKALAGH